MLILRGVIAMAMQQSRKNNFSNTILPKVIILEIFPLLFSSCLCFEHSKKDQNWRYANEQAKIFERFERRDAIKTVPFAFATDLNDLGWSDTCFGMLHVEIEICNK